MEFAADPHTGAKAVKFTGLSDAKAPVNLLCYSPPIKVQGGQDYILSVWHHASQGAAPSVSFFAFAVPWAKAQWDTPRLAYETSFLPSSDPWAPWTWRIRVPPAAKELVIALRSNSLGTVWFDDAALFPAEESPLEITDPGSVTALPDKRRLGVRIADSIEAARCKISVVDLKTGKVLATQTGAPADHTAILDYIAPDNLSINVILEDAGAGIIFAAVPIAAPPLLSLEMVSPRYRNALYLSTRPSQIHARLHCAAAASLLAGASFALRANDREVLHPAPLQPSNDLQFPLPDLTGLNEIALSVSLQGLPGHDRLRLRLPVIPPPSSGHEVIVGDRNETLLDGKPFFAAGFYGPPYGERSKPIARAGYTAALTYASDLDECQSWLDSCKWLGLLGIVSVPLPFVTHFDEEKLRASIRAIREHPALLAYNLFDEPYLGQRGQTPADLRRVYEVVAQEDPWHPMLISICVPEYVGAYRSACDIFMPDPYPLVSPQRPLTQVVDWIESARAAIANTKPVWVAPQSFGWDLMKGCSDPQDYQIPSPAQERCMTYLALAHDVQGLMYYGYHVFTSYDAAKAKAGDWPYVIGGYLPEKRPQLWQTLARLGAEMHVLGPFFQRPQSQSGVEGTIHWRLIPPMGGSSGCLLAVNADPLHSAEIPLPARVDRQSVSLVYGPGLLKESDAATLIHLGPLETLAAKIAVPEAKKP
jgi:hypothetical protein